MNREQRRKIEKKAKEVWKLELQATLISDEDMKRILENQMKKIISNCSLEELLLIDEYINEQFVHKD
jgi:hypothetical protein